MTCPCMRVPDPGVCPITHDGQPANGHCRCAHPDYRPPACECFADRGMSLFAMCPDHWRMFEEELVGEPNVILALTAAVRRVVAEGGA